MPTLPVDRQALVITTIHAGLDTELLSTVSGHLHHRIFLLLLLLPHKLVQLMAFLEWTFTALVISEYSILRHTEKSQQVIRNLTPTLTT